MEPFSYPPEYRHVEQLVRETNERIQQIDQDIENLPPDREGWVPPANRPPGTPPPPIQPTRQQVIDARRGFQQSERERVFQEVEKATAGAEPKLKRRIQDSARENLFGNEYKEMDRDAFEAAGYQPKGFEQSANYMDAHLGKKPNPNPGGSGPSSPPQPDPGPDDPRPNGPTRPNSGQRQNQSTREPQTPAALAAFSLNFSTMAQKEVTDKAKVPKKEETRTEKTQLPSEQAEQELRGRYEPSKADNLSDKSPAPEKDDGPDIDR